MQTRTLLAVAFLAPAFAAAQSSPFVDENTERLLVNAISGDRAFETLRITTQWHKPSGSEGFFAVARYVEDKAKEAGLDDVTWIDQVAETPSWTCRRAEAWLLQGEGQNEKETFLGSYADVATSIADFSRSADVTADLVDVGSGEAASDYAGKEVRGKVVLASGSPIAVTEQAVWKRGAAGILSYASTRLNALAEAPDQVAWLRVPEEDGPGGQKTTFAFVISARAGAALAERLAGKTSHRIFAAQGPGRGEPLRVHIVVDASSLPEKKTAMVEAVIRGREPALPEVVLTSHLQEEKFSANDNQSGVASMLEIGRALTRLIAEGRLPRPRRSIRFWWCDEIYSEYRYFADHPGAERRFLVNLNQDMVGARQSAGGRTQFLSRTPWSRPSFLSDVQESILDAVVEGNSAALAVWQAHSTPPGVAFSRPIFSFLGTREPYHARAVPYFDSTDHLVFNDSWIGVAGTTLTNWPDEYIHSSGDDLWQIDPTQLKRNAFVVAATALWIANADASSVQPLAQYVAARGAGRMAGDLATAMEWTRTGKGEPEARRRAAEELLSVSLEKELASLDSVRQVGPVAVGDAAAFPRLASGLRSTAATFRAELDVAAGTAGAAGPDAVMTRMEARTPRFAAATLDEWLTLRENVARKQRQERRARREEREKQEALAGGRKGAKAPGPPPEEDEPTLSSLMQAEVLNWIDGKRNAAEVARRVCAEALSAGWWYYGETTPARVEKFLEKSVRESLLVW
jgi:Zn-dependent M28 family amino/carboxypeptidase